MHSALCILCIICAFCASVHTTHASTRTLCTFSHIFSRVLCHHRCDADTVNVVSNPTEPSIVHHARVQQHTTADARNPLLGGFGGACHLRRQRRQRCRRMHFVKECVNTRANSRRRIKAVLAIQSASVSFGIFDNLQAKSSSALRVRAPFYPPVIHPVGLYHHPSIPST